jgi:hypothetical protein
VNISNWLKLVATNDGKLAGAALLLTSAKRNAPPIMPHEGRELLTSAKRNAPPIMPREGRELLTSAKRNAPPIMPYEGRELLTSAKRNAPPIMPREGRELLTSAKRGHRLDKLQGSKSQANPLLSCTLTGS